MAGNNAIGTGAIILTASSDKLAAGLSVAEGRINKFAGDAGKKLDKIGKGGGDKAGGGLFGGLKAGAAAGLAMKGVELVGRIPEMIGKLAEKATGGDKGALEGIIGGIDRLIAAGEGLLTKGLAAAAPAITGVIDTVLKAFERFQPVIDVALAAYERWWFFLSELFNEVVSWVSETVAGIAQWAEEFTGLSVTSESAGQLVWRVAKLITEGFAYAWDTIKAGGGVVAIVAGKIVEGFGWVVEKIGEAYSRLADFLGELPDEIKVRMPWIDDLKRGAERFKGFRGDIDQVGKGMEAWGERQLSNWGKSVEQADQWFDKMVQRFDDKKAGFARQAEAAAPDKTEPPKLAGALEYGSKEAYSAAARWQANNLVTSTNAAAAQLRATQETNRKLDELGRAVRDIGLNEL